MLLSLAIASIILLTTSSILGLKFYKLSKRYKTKVKNAIKTFTNTLQKDIQKLNAEQEELERNKKEFEEYKTETNSQTIKIYDQLAANEVRLVEKEKQLEADYKKRNKEFEKRNKEFEKEREQAISEAEEEIKNYIEKIDNMLEDKLIAIAAQNTMQFTCACNDKPIPCSIDLSQENTYRCSECGSVYRVDIRMNPVLIGKAISDEEYIQKIQERLDNEEF